MSFAWARTALGRVWEILFAGISLSMLVGFRCSTIRICAGDGGIVTDYVEE